MGAPNDQGKPESAATSTADEPTAPSQAPVPPAAESAPAPEEPTTLPPKVADVDGYRAKREAALKEQAAPKPGEPAEAAPAPEAPKPEEAAPPAEEPAPGEPNPGEPAPAEPVPPKSEFRPRLDALPEDEKEAITLRRQLKSQGQDVPLAECLRRVQAKYGISEAPAAAPQSPAAAEPQHRTIDQVKADIATAKSEKRTAIKDIDPDAQIAAEDKLDALSEELSTIERAESQRAHQREQQELSTFEQTVQDTGRQVNSLYPDTTDDKHPIHVEAERIYALLEKTGNPKAHEADSALWVYQQAANKLGILPVDPDAPAPPAAPAAAKPSPSATPKLQPVIQAAAPGRSAQPVIPTGGARTTQPGQPAPHLEKATTRHDYEAKKARLGIG